MYILLINPLVVDNVYLLFTVLPEGESTVIFKKRWRYSRAVDGKHEMVVRQGIFVNVVEFCRYGNLLTKIRYYPACQSAYKCLARQFYCVAIRKYCEL